MKIGIGAVTIEPEALPIACFHPEIIAGGFFFFPPFHGDALGPLDAGDVELSSPPAKAQRRVFRYARRGYLYFLGLFQQPKRTKWWVILFAAARPCALEVAVL